MQEEFVQPVAPAAPFMGGAEAGDKFKQAGGTVVAIRVQLITQCAGQGLLGLVAQSA